MRGIDYFGTLIMWLAVFIGWLIKGCKTNLFKECAKIEDSTCLLYTSPSPRD